MREYDNLQFRLRATRPVGMAHRARIMAATGRFGMRMATEAGMSWKEAQSHAERWLQSLKLGKTSGQYVDLHERTEGLPENAEFRAMVIEAAKRALKKQGAKTVWMPE